MPDHARNVFITHLALVTTTSGKIAKRTGLTNKMGCSAVSLKTLAVIGI